MPLHCTVLYCKIPLCVLWVWSDVLMWYFGIVYFMLQEMISQHSSATARTLTNTRWNYWRESLGWKFQFINKWFAHYRLICRSLLCELKSKLFNQVILFRLMEIFDFSSKMFHYHNLQYFDSHVSQCHNLQSCLK